MNIPDIDAEFLNSDIFLATTPEDMGVRTRLIEAFAHGCCCIAHSANSVGQPEFQAGVNIALGATGREIADLLNYYAARPEDRLRMGNAARQTFEESYAPEKTGGAVADALERICQ